MNGADSPGATARPSREAWWLGGLFAAALVYSVANVGYHWTMGFLAGHEFRQAQTAITSYYIDRDNNFGLLYETPILGKPWVSILMEVPFYEWAVVGLSRATGWPHVVAARTVSATCFYLTLPAFYLLLGRLGLSRPRRLLPLALIVMAPVYIYYSRAFLMDSMALMFSAWWLLGFVRTMDVANVRITNMHRGNGPRDEVSLTNMGGGGGRAGWLAFTILTGSLAALVKSATFAIWLIPGAGYGAWLLWRDLRARRGWRPPVATVLWGAATVGVALGLLRLWVRYTDPLKDAHASAWIFSSKALTQGNWGLFDFKAIFSAEVWRLWMGCWEQAMLSRWLLGAGLVASLVPAGARGRALGLGAVFFLAQFLFPFAYAYQDYYYYSCAAFALAAVGCGLTGLLDTRAPRALVGLLALVPLGAEIIAYRREYRPQQAIVFNGVLPYMAALRDCTPPGSVLVVGGADWAAMTPYYAERKALMVRNGLEWDSAYLTRAFRELAGEEMSAVVVFGPVRQNQDFINAAAARFDIDTKSPTFSSATADVYIARPYVKRTREKLRDTVRYPDLTVTPPSPDERIDGTVDVTPDVAQQVFMNFSPKPVRARILHGAGLQDGVVLAHTPSDAWLPAPRQATQIRMEFGIFAAAYAKPDAHTDGVVFLVEIERADGSVRRIYQRMLDPWTDAADRGEQHATIPYQPLPGDVLHFSTRPGGGTAFDWAYWRQVEVE